MNVSDTGTGIEIDLGPADPRLEAVYAAIEAAQTPGKEGPFGLFDYSDYGDPVPHHVRDFRDPRSGTYGNCVFKSINREDAFGAYERFTREHVAIAAVTATLQAFGVAVDPRVDPPFHSSEAR
ncbi:hypothetical protein [Sphingomonas sp. 3-13AW]|uniref:hypothetical protein n=1 Tax=Sphingomonas sp. 3-13AW TaxID=3050450 RepID=UPI003BB657E9